MSKHVDHTRAPTLAALIGFGEAGCALAEGWRADLPALSIRAFDIKAASTDNTVAAAMWDRYQAYGVVGSDAVRDTLKSACAVFSLVTADQAHEAAKDAAESIAPGSLFFDCNSCAPDTKRASAQVIEAAGARYVDTAVMAPIRPRLHKTPLLISGPHGEAALATLKAMGMNAQRVDGDVGRASSVKMLRSVMIKGIEALTLESLLSARAAGVEEEVIASLDASMPGFGWAARAAYNLERVTTHGTRRAAEMREVAKTVDYLDLPPRMARAIADWQDEIGALGLAPGKNNYQARADAILSARENAKMEDTP